jgi:hypothetical protein
MSRRRSRSEGDAQRPARGKPPTASPAAATTHPGPAPGRGPYRIRPRNQVAILIAVFAVVTLIAELAGAANLGVALGIGQIAFGVALVIVLVRS